MPRQLIKPVVEYEFIEDTQPEVLDELFDYLLGKFFEDKTSINNDNNL